jgi:serine/threonine protein kinase
MPSEENLPKESFEIEPLPIPHEPCVSHSGEVVGNYEVLEEIGRGGMGSIYAAKHKTIDRRVAIKFLSTILTADPLYADRFVREAEAAARLNHPGIVALHDAGRLENDVYYLIMEYVDGQDLHAIVSEHGVFSVADAANMVCQAAEALGYAHQANFIHRDIKPENILLAADGTVKICDLGLAKRVGEDGMITQRGMIMGSPNYMAPERLRCSTEIDARVDIYSLGAALFFLLTGHIPYEGTPPVIMAKHLTAPLPDPREVRSDLPEEICHVIRKMMEKNPADRYQSMAEVVAALAPFQKRPGTEKT